MENYLRCWIKNLMLIAEDYGQIADTVKHYQRRGYDLKIPLGHMIEKTNDLHLFFSDPCLVLGQNITVHPFENVRLTFNANVFYGMVNAVSDYTRQERGALYKFDILNNGPTLFLPESMMRFLHDYDWNQHMLQVNEWLARREEKLRTLETTGTFKRIRRLEVVLN